MLIISRKSTNISYCYLSNASLLYQAKFLGIYLKCNFTVSLMEKQLLRKTAELKIFRLISRQCQQTINVLLVTFQNVCIWYKPKNGKETQQLTLTTPLTSVVLGLRSQYIWTFCGTLNHTKNMHMVVLCLFFIGQSLNK